jgi:hypothetical protein
MTEEARPRSPSDLSIRRTAWRLDTLGRALVGDGVSGGLAALGGGTEAAARDLGQRLRDAARMIIADPVEEVVLDVIDAFAAEGLRPGQDSGTEQAAPADGQAAAPNPFGEQ